MDKVWNGKIKGLPSAICLSMEILINKLFDKLMFSIHKSNFNYIGTGTVIYRGLTFRYPGNIKIGKNCTLNKNISLGSEFNKATLTIGNNVIIAQNVKLDFTGNLEIMDNVTISESVTILTHDHGLVPRSIPIKKELKIMENVWVGSNAIILQNVNLIGMNSVIAAGSVVSNDVPPDTIFGGNPAELIRKIS